MFSKGQFRWALLSGLFIILFFTVTPHAHAIESNNALDRIVDVYATKAAGWESVLKGFAVHLFWMLALIELGWTGIKLAFKGADFSEVLSALFSHILFIGFFFWLVNNSPMISHAIVDSFREMAGIASSAIGGTNGIMPSNVFDAGMDIVKKITNTMSIWDPGDSIMFAIAAFAILISFALMAAFLIMALVESYFVISAGVIMMGFGGSRWTKEYAVSTLRYTVSVGVKLYLAQLLIGVGQSILNDLVMQVKTSDMSINDAWLVAGISVVFMALTKVIPDSAQAYTRGDSVATGHHLAGMVTTAAATGAAAGAAMISGGASGLAGTGAALHGAWSVASEKRKDAASGGSGGSDSSSGTPTTGPSGMPKFVEIAMSMGKETASAARSNVGKRFRGERIHGNFGAQIGADMTADGAAIRQAREKREAETRKQAEEQATKNQSNNRIYPS